MACGADTLDAPCWIVALVGVSAMVMVPVVVVVSLDEQACNMPAVASKKAVARDRQGDFCNIVYPFLFLVFCLVLDVQVRWFHYSFAWTPADRFARTGIEVRGVPRGIVSTRGLVPAIRLDEIAHLAE